MSAVAFSISQCFTDVKSRLLYSSLHPKVIASGLKEGTTSRLEDLGPSSHSNKKGALHNIGGEIHIRPFQSSDADKVRELFLDSNIGPNSFLAQILRDQWTGRIALFCYSALLLGSLQLVFQPRRRSMGLGLVLFGALGAILYRLIPEYMISHHLKVAMNGDLADIGKTFQVDESETGSRKLYGKNGFWVAEYHGEQGEREVVGCVGINANTPGAGKVGATTSELRRMVVSPNYRRRGIAQNLIKEAVKHARERGVEHIYLTTLSYQEAAVKMYLKLGWEVRKHFKPTILFDKLYAYELLLDVKTCNL